jgi:hypothetical protein
MISGITKNEQRTEKRPQKMKPKQDKGSKPAAPATAYQASKVKK